MTLQGEDVSPHLSDQHEPVSLPTACPFRGKAKARVELMENVTATDDIMKIGSSSHAPLADRIGPTRSAHR
jgi:hypothetical protein